MTVKVSAPLPPLTSTVSLPSPPSLRSVSSPGFQIIRSLPASPKTWSSPSPPVSDVVAVAAEQEVGAALAEQGVVAGLAEELVVARAAGQRVVAGAAEEVGVGQCAVGLVESDGVVAALAKHLDQGGVGDRRLAAQDGHGAAVDQDFPAASRLVVIVLSRASPNSVSTPVSEKASRNCHRRILSKVFIGTRCARLNFGGKPEGQAPVALVRTAVTTSPIGVYDRHYKQIFCLTYSQYFH